VSSEIFCCVGEHMPYIMKMAVTGADPYFPPHLQVKWIFNGWLFTGKSSELVNLTGLFSHSSSDQEDEI